MTGMDHLGRKALELIAGRFRVLSNPTRLELLQLLCQQERTVSELVRETGHKQANVSKQLGQLDQAGMVRRRVDGNFVYYSIADDSLPRLCDVIRQSIKDQQVRLLDSLD